MHYRLFFMDALRRVTGRDLFKTHAAHMNADLALASIAARRTGGYDQDHANTVLEPSYGQLDYYAPVLVCLAREYRRGIYQHLALWDETLGQIQKTRYVTPHGEPLLFELGGYAFVWFDPDGRSRRPTTTKLVVSFSLGRRSLPANVVAGRRSAGRRAQGRGRRPCRRDCRCFIEPMAGRESAGLDRSNRCPTRPAPPRSAAPTSGPAVARGHA